MSASDQKVDEVKRILHGVRPDYTPYAQQLVENGFDSVVNLGMSKVEDLVACGVKRGHAREIVDSLAPKKQPVVKPVTSVVAPLVLSAGPADEEKTIGKKHELTTSTLAGSSSNANGPEKAMDIQAQVQLQVTQAEAMRLKEVIEKAGIMDKHSNTQYSFFNSGDGKKLRMMGKPFTHEMMSIAVAKRNGRKKRRTTMNDAEQRRTPRLSCVFCKLRGTHRPTSVFCRDCQVPLCGHRRDVANDSIDTKSCWNLFHNMDPLPKPTRSRRMPASTASVPQQRTANAPSISVPVVPVIQSSQANAATAAPSTRPLHAAPLQAVVLASQPPAKAQPPPPQHAPTISVSSVTNPIQGTNSWPQN